VRHLRDEIGLELGQIALSVQEDPDQDDARHEGAREGQHQNADQNVVPSFTQDDERHADRTEQDGRYDDQRHEEFDDSLVTERREISPSAAHTHRWTNVARRREPGESRCHASRGRVDVSSRLVQTLVELIAKKRDGGRLSNEQIERLVRAFGSGELADYQMSALCMAIFFRGMDDEETVALTRAMLHSGDVIDLGDVPGVKVDKHSTGGVGDKVSLCLAPLVAACGVPVPMVSGRGLGHTGGTLDKLEAIPGFNVSLDVDAFARIVRDLGVCMIGQTARIAPADKRIYALRDVTATVESTPLIVASILSKKLAEGIDALVLDVKVGRGAFMKTEADARVLAEALVRVGTSAGKRVVALLTDMSAPLGAAIGNAIETREAIDVLRGYGPADLIECTLALGAEMLVLGGVAASDTEARDKLKAAIASGQGARVFERMIEAQGGDPRVVEHPSLLPTAPVHVMVPAQHNGVVAAIDSLELGLTAVAMGAGRTRADQPVDHAVGIEILAPRGTQVAQGQPLARLHVRSQAAGEAIVDRVQNAFRITDALGAPTPLVLGRIV
jgi:pyrimidine-nucleoside phosphorylase